MEHLRQKHTHLRLSEIGKKPVLIKYQQNKSIDAFNKLKTLKQNNPLSVEVVI